METVAMTITGVRVELPNNAPVVLLRETNGVRTVPIWVGATEAVAISSAMEGDTPPRPLTHDLFCSTIAEMGARFISVVITHLSDNVFYSELTIEQGGSRFVVSARPSDAIALAVRTDTPVFAALEVVTEVGVVLPEDAEAADAVAQFREFLEDVTIEDFINPDQG